MDIDEQFDKLIKDQSDAALPQEPSQQPTIQEVDPNENEKFKIKQFSFEIKLPFLEKVSFVDLNIYLRNFFENTLKQRFLDKMPDENYHIGIQNDEDESDGADENEDYDGDEPDPTERAVLEKGSLKLALESWVDYFSSLPSMPEFHEIWMVSKMDFYKVKPRERRAARKMTLNAIFFDEMTEFSTLVKLYIGK